MDVFEILNLNELALGLSNLSMFPYFDMAHYIISVMSLREQPGKSNLTDHLYASNTQRTSTVISLFRCISEHVTCFHEFKSCIAL